MTDVKATIDRLVTFGAALSAPLLTLLVDQSVISATTATDLGAVVAAAVGAYHGGALAQRKAAPKPAGRTP